MIYITGDTHGGYDIKKFDKHTFKGDDIVIVCGDFGYVWEHDPLYYKAERGRLDLFIKNIGCTVLFVDGNHSNFARLNDYPVIRLYGGNVHKVAENCYHLIRGEKYEINGYKFLAIGGAESHDMHIRKEGLNWWKEESITDEEINKAIANCGGIDFVLSHTAPTDLHYKLFVNNYLPMSTFNASHSCTQLEKLRRTLDEKGKPYKWFLGHYHYDLDWKPYFVLYNQFYCVEKGYWDVCSL